MQQQKLTDRLGTYWGLSPTDESAIAAGEARLVIGADSLEFSLAAGHEVITETMPAELFVPMTKEEVATHFEKGAESAVTSVGFKGRETGFPVLLFGSGGDLVVFTGGMGDLLGPSLFVGPGRIARLKAWLMSWILDFQTKGGFPRFRYGGKTRRYA